MENPCTLSVRFRFSSHSERTRMYYVCAYAYSHTYICTFALTHTHKYCAKGKAPENRLGQMTEQFRDPGVIYGPYLTSQLPSPYLSPAFFQYKTIYIRARFSMPYYLSSIKLMYFWDAFYFRRKSSEKPQFFRCYFGRRGCCISEPFDKYVFPFVTLENFPRKGHAIP